MTEPTVHDSFVGNSVALPRLSSSLTVSSSTDDENKRSTWSRQLDFFLSCVGYAVGLGNIWRFPYLCYKSGGGAFLIPYVIFLVICGIPLFFLEMSLGQFGSLGPIAIWKISPIFKGLGFGMAIVSGVVCVYYNVIIAWALYYIYQSYSVSWSSCENAWNTPNCVSQNDMNVLLNNTSFTNISDLYNSTGVSRLLETRLNNFYFSFKVLKQSTGIENMGAFQWPLVLSLFIAWILVFLCMLRGIKSSGKVVYVTATFPYCVLLCLLIRGLTLPGAWNGISFYLSPQWEKLLTFKVWGDAATQIFYSVGAAWGALLTMASYNKFSNNVYRDSLVVPLINCGTSVLAGFVVFSLLGFMAEETGKSVADVVSEGPGLAFVVYPEAIARLPVSPVWAFLFFFMLFAVGLDTQFGMFETAVSAFVDEYPNFLQKRKTLFTAFLCILMFLLGLPCVTQGGIYVVQLMDWYSAAFSLMVISLLETVAVAWIYGVDRFLHDIFLMTNKRPSNWWKICWCYITPATIIALLLFILINHTAITYNDYIYPTWSIGIGWIIAMCSITPIPVVAAVILLKQKGCFKERLMKSLRPSSDWGPALEENRIQYRKSLSIVSSRFDQKYTEQVPDVAKDIDADQDEQNEACPFRTETAL
ncbi:unnamed protein product [Larinioides sclopetarius]|uniref:Transporter n=1 Tax=Larinioides sclopetarius TaxID=280406 RepID=A0AAV1YYD2_9ARAC